MPTLQRSDDRAAAAAPPTAGLPVVAPGLVPLRPSYLLAIEDPAMLRADLAVQQVHYSTVRLQQGIGNVCCNDEHEGRGSDPQGTSGRARTGRLVPGLWRPDVLAA